MNGLRTMVASGIVAGVLAAMPVAAVDTPIAATKLKVADGTQPGTARRKIVFASRGPGIVIPAESSGADPTLHGGSVEIANTAGSGESDTIALPAGNWRRTPINPANPLRGWKYKEVVSSPPTDDYKIKVALRTTYSGAVLRVVVKDDRGSVIAYTLDEPTQGSIGLRLSTGADRQCADFGASSTIVADESTDLGSGA